MNSDICWTFPIQGSNSLVVSWPCREGLLLLNSTAAWVWQRRFDLQLEIVYSEFFAVDPARAKSDVAGLLRNWEQLPPAADQATPRSNFVAPQQLHIACKIAETQFLLRFSGATLTAELAPRIIPAHLSAAVVHYTFDLYEHLSGACIVRDGTVVADEPFITSLRVILLQELTRLAVPGRDFKIILHAGAVGNTNACVILAGASFSGKSTLCTALMQSGLLCYSDDSACLTPDLQVCGMPFAISLREGSWPLFPHLDKPRFVPSNLNGTSPTAPPVALVFVNYQPDAETSLETIDTFDALVGLQQSGFWVEHTEASIASFIDWLGRLPIYRLTYSDIHAAMHHVRTLLEAAPIAS